MLDLRKRAMQSWCTVCNCPAGMDCPDKAADNQTAKAIDRRAWQAEAKHELDRRAT